MGALKGFGRRLHQLHVQMLGVKAHPLFPKGVPDITIVYFIDIFFFYTGADGVEILGCLRCGHHSDVPRQAGVDGQGQPVQGDAAVAFEIGAVAQGVYAGVSAAAANQLYRVAADLFQGFLHGLTDGDVVFLHLPAVVAAAVVFQSQGDISHNPNFLSTMIPARKRTETVSAA